MFYRIIVLVLVVFAAHQSSEAQEKRKEAAMPSASLDDLVGGKLNIIDLTYPLNQRSNYWPGEKYKPFKLETIATLDKDGVLSKAFSMPEHMGTHIDAPNHFEPNQPALHQIEPKDLFVRRRNDRRSRAGRRRQ